jgi:NAD(P)-dependent dehydrogenase (short-subunit alcohol dehydrogenase family)
VTETVVITGASAEIGRATAELFGRRGAHGDFDDRSRSSSAQLDATETAEGAASAAIEALGGIKHVPAESKKPGDERPPA